MAASGGGGGGGSSSFSSPSRPPFPLLVRWGLVAAAAATLALLARPCGAGLYEAAAAGADPAVWVLAAGTARRALRDSPSAWLVQFYSSACGHCVAFAPLWRALAGDVHDWEPAIRIGVLDCGDEENYEACKEYRIQFYPTFRYFRAFTKQFTTGESQHAGSDRELQTIRQTMIDFLQNHSRETKPPACPPLEPVVPEEIFSLFDKSSQHYTAIIFESANSYVGREVILDMIQYENIVVKRVLDSETAFLEKLGIASVPSSYLIYPNGSHGLINTLKPLRSVFSSYLKSLPGVRRRRLSSSQLPVPVREGNRDVKEWKDYDKSKLYMADLESGLHYLLRVELATHQTLEGAELRTFKDFVVVLAKLFPGRQPLLKLLETLQVWLVSLPLDKIPYDAILDLLNNKMRISGLFLTSRVQWVGCQGSRPELRGYTCSFWKLFHTLTVQAAVRPKALLNTGLEGNPRAVLEILQKYIQDFFGCRACAQHFEAMARESLARVQSLDEAVLWLWEKHNVVNARLAGDLSEDPKFPKVQWPTPDLCPACHEENKGLHTWNKAQVLQFLKQHYGSGNLVHPYTEGPADLEEGELPGERGADGPYKKPSRRDEDKVPAPEWRVLDQLSAKDSPSKDPGQKAAESIREEEEEVKQAVSFLGFSNIDMSLCVVLYMTSSLFLMILYFFFRMRSKRWKVRHYRPYV